MNQLSIYKSSAGSGKTFTLVKEYLKIVLQNPSAYRHTLAITFTNKATAEMKERIVSSLVKLSEDKADELKQLLTEELNNPKIIIRERAQQVLESVLHDYSSFAVSTIDSFFSRVVRSLAKEMQLPLKFEMEMNQDFITTRLTEMLLEDVGKSKELTEWLQQFVFSKMDDEKGWNIEHEIKFIAKEVFTDRQYAGGEDKSKQVNLAFIETLRKIKFGFEKQMKEFGQEFIQVMDAEGLTVDDFAYGKGGVANYFIKIFNGVSGKEWLPGSRVTAAMESVDKWTTKTSPKKMQITALAESTLVSLAQKTVTFCNTHFKDYVSAAEVLALAYMAGIVNYLKEKMSQYRDENDVLMISDNSQLLKKFIDGSDTPFVYEKTGNRFKNYLVDEFQDTSDVQWDNLLPLVINGLGSGGFVMLVGDAKQSVYRWRGGNMKLLLETIHRDLQSFADLKKSFTLGTNYRSYQQVVDFNNTFFSQAPTLLPVSDDKLTKLAYLHEDTHQLNLDKKSSGGFVSVTLIPKKETNENEEEVKWKEAAMQKMVGVINNAISQGYRGSDIAIIVRTNKDGKQVADFLFKNGYPKISAAESLLLYTAPQVIFLINVLQVLAYPADKPAWAEVAYFYQVHILKNNDPALHEIFSSVGYQFKGYNTFLPDQFNKLKDSLVSTPLYEAVEKLVEIFSLNKTPDAYIQRFQDLVLDFGSKNLPSIKDFLNWWDDHKESERLAVVGPDDHDAINIISIHRSKGLQYPVVIIPFLDWNLKPKPDSLLWISSDEEPFSRLSQFPIRATGLLSHSHFSEQYLNELDENYLDNLNLLYVAFTRAEEKLFICAPLNDKMDKEPSSISQLLYRIIDGHEPWKSKLKNVNGTILLELGEDHQAIIQRKSSDRSATFDEPENISLESYPYNRWQDQINVRISRGFMKAEEEKEKMAAIGSGLLLHEAMSFIRHRSDKKTALQKVAGIHLLNETEIQQLEEELEQVFILTENQKWFDEGWHILNESEMASPGGIILRPDRVMIKEEQVIVIDYKTGAKDKKHHQQVNDYAKALMAMGHGNVKGYLLYLHEKAVVEVEG